MLKPLLPPTAEAKPFDSSAEENTEKAKAEKMSEKNADVKEKTGPPPTPPNKPSSSSSMSNPAEASQSRPNSHPPTPPSKEKKPSNYAMEPGQEVQDTTDENKEKEDKNEEKKKIAMETEEAEQLIPKEAPPSFTHDEPESAEGQASEEKSEEIISSGINGSSDNVPQAPAESLRQSPSPHMSPKKSPYLVPKKRPEKPVQLDMQRTEDKATINHPTEGQDPTALLPTGSGLSVSSPQAGEALPEGEVPSVVVVSLNDPVTDSLSLPVTDGLSLSPLLCHLHSEKKKKAEEKSVDSGQHSDDDSEDSGSEDTLAASTAALRGSHAGLDVLDVNEDDIQISVNVSPAQAATKSQVRSEVFGCPRPKPTPPLKPSAKAKSASIGDLLSDSSACIQERHYSRALDGNARAGSDDVLKLEAEVALEMEKTSKLLSRVSLSQRGGEAEGMPVDLLAKAMEKLQKADHVLREVKKLKPAKNSSNRKSW